jgi:hypothetical protein
MNTSLYNHKAVGTQEKPLIPNRDLKLICVNLDSVLEQLQNHSLESVQINLLLSKVNNIIKEL